MWTLYSLNPQKTNRKQLYHTHYLLNAMIIVSQPNTKRTFSVGHIHHHYWRLITQIHDPAGIVFCSSVDAAAFCEAGVAWPIHGTSCEGAVSSWSLPGWFVDRYIGVRIFRRFHNMTWYWIITSFSLGTISLGIIFGRYQSQREWDISSSQTVKQPSQK